MAFTEYRPLYRPSADDSASAAANPGDVLFANVTFNEAAQTYTAFHKNLNSGWSVSHTLPVQRRRDGTYKNYTIACESISGHCCAGAVI